MKCVPELWELIALFETEPVYVYGEESEVPWFYSTINFSLRRDHETLDVSISPAVGVIEIWVFTGDRKLMQFNFDDVHGMKIEKLHNKEILHILFSDEGRVKQFYIETKPHIFVHCSRTQYE